MPITTGTTGDLKNFSLTCARAVIFLRLATSTIEFHALPLRALFLCPQPCHQPSVFERVAEPSLSPVVVMGKDVFPPKWPKLTPFFSV